MANFIRPLQTECLGYTSWPLRSSKEIPLFIEDVTERVISQLVPKSTRTLVNAYLFLVNSYLSQLVPKSTRT